MILIISSIFSFGMTKVILFLAYATRSPRIFLWKMLSIGEANAIKSNGTKTFLFRKQQLLSMNQQLFLKNHQEIYLIEWL